ncbi:MAG: hypothetical protein GF365_01550 [Candidatus Buchananbacteria bacterium]|nr:hypothetical protein [Candidatus Buchananbacteria bacterium]
MKKLRWLGPYLFFLPWAAMLGGMFSLLLYGYMPDTKFTGIGYVIAVSSILFYVGFCGIITAIPKSET